MYYLLFYDFVENIVERRAPYREEHLKLVREAHKWGEREIISTYRSYGSIASALS